MNIHEKYGDALNECAKHSNDPLLRTHLNGILFSTIISDLCYIDEFYVLEFGVADGGHLGMMCEIAKLMKNTFGVKIKVVGFDNFSGLPTIQPPFDHPEMWNPGQFKSVGKDIVFKRCKDIYDDVILVEGGVKETSKSFPLSKECPVGFISVDLDLYTSTKNCFELLKRDREFFLPIVGMYFDDVHRVISYNPFCGEQKAISEFNTENENRKIAKRFGIDTSLYNFYTFHVLDHPVLLGEKSPKEKFELFLPF